MASQLTSFSSHRPPHKVPMPRDGGGRAALNQLWQFAITLVLLPSWTFAYAAGRRLHCLSCVQVEGDTTTLDQFRIRHGLPMPHCDMESVECDAHQDTCVTITMKMTQRQFWVGSGCDQRVNYDFPSGGRDGCVEMPAVYRNYHPGFMEERRTLQRVCLCSGNLCNSATRHTTSLVLPLLLFLTSTAFIALKSRMERWW